MAVRNDIPVADRWYEPETNGTDGYLYDLCTGTIDR